MASGKKVAVLSLAGILVVAAVVAVTVTVTRKNDNGSSQASSVKSNVKAIDTICQPTDHKEVCVETLSASDEGVSDPQQLVQLAFNITMRIIEKSEKNITGLLNDLTKDPKTSKAFDQCNEVLALANRDLYRSADTLSKLDITKINEILNTVKVWLSAALTYEDTCLDGFQNTTGNASDRMKNLLKKGMDMTENMLGMVTEVESALSGKSFGRRRLLSDGLPSWVGASTRKLMAAKPKNIKADIVVAKDGSGKFKTIMAAIDSIPKDKKRTKPFVVHVKEGVYVEKVVIPKEVPHLVLMGDGPTKTKITGSLSVSDGVTTTYHSASFSVMADYFMARDIGFENTAGPENHQAVAARVSGDFAAFQNCRFDGYQDTLYVHAYRQYYRDCTVTGTIDFVFGDAAAVFQNCNLLVRKCGADQFNAVTAQGRKNPKMPTGIVLQNCNIKEDPQNPPLKTTKSYLGRPWKTFSRTIIMESYIGSVIAPEGYTPWFGVAFEDTCFYSEYNNRGDRVNKNDRVKWKGIYNITKEVAEMFTADKFIDGSQWLPAAGVPYTPGFFLPTPPAEKNAIGLSQSGEWKKDHKKEEYKEKKDTTI